jgi:redox-sensitive bicupin YhaK (pirin superfamily)
MIVRRPSEECGRTSRWLDRRHTFTFADYHDPAYMGFRSLRVINEDRVQPGQGLGMHAHRHIEISYGLEGELAHRDRSRRRTGARVRSACIRAGVVVFELA